MAELDIPGIDGLAGQARVLVKNTFLDLDDVPRMPELNRLRTAPAGGNVGIDGDEDEGDDLDDLDDAEDAAITGESPDSAAPEMPGIYRQVTCDGFEPMAQWHWTQSASAIDPRLSVEWEPELTPEAPPPTPTGGQAPMPMMHPAQNCVMIVPNSMVPGQGMMMAMMPAPLAVQGFGELDACPPGCMAVRADMYGRWPVQQYAAPQANTTGGLSAASAPAASASAAPPAAGKGSGGYGGSSATAASPPVAPAALQASMMPAEGPHEFSIALRKPPGGKIGLKVDQFEGVSLEVTRIKEGLVQDWNSEHGECQVMKGDRIVEVNGVRDSSPKMLDTLTAEEDLFLVIQRPS